MARTLSGKRRINFAWANDDSSASGQGVIEVDFSSGAATASVTTPSQSGIAVAAKCEAWMACDAAATDATTAAQHIADNPYVGCACGVVSGAGGTFTITVNVTDDKIGGTPVSNASPIDGDVLFYNGANGQYEPGVETIDDPGTAGHVLVDSGTAWKSKAVSGDVTLSSTGAVAVLKVNGVAVAAPTTKGDLWATAAGPTVNRIAVGTDGQVLTADAASTNGVKWATPGGGSLPDPVTVAHGGTGLTTLTSHAVQVGAGTSTPAQVGPDSSTTKPLFSGGSSADPGFRAIAVGDLPTITAAIGGTGQTSYAVGDIPYASASTTISKLAAVAAGAYLRSAGVTTAPAWSTVTLPNAATTGDIITATGSNTFGVLAAGAVGTVPTSAGAGAALVNLPPGVVAWLVAANGGTTINVNVDTTIYTVPTAPTNASKFICTGVVGIITQAGVASSGTPTHTLTVGKTAGGAGFLASQSVLIATAVATKYGLTISQLGAEFVSTDGYNATLSAGDAIIVRYAIANSGGISTQIITRWTVTGYWI